eukprot:CAMPEP_0201177440 /NCGR_PEP_ID=MMETSP0851-20130426/107599_1 /ASSEMBLY_ACC=CAM_ASM_000631 /TAXON_ID=183588 /ORGANISM="Pseudo-nitzschia fraudulenta, Strain WWA7" /LENGTH=293 /DNA_ID=CAMNT_0047461047 /DNA_START=260 /DNA_END=1141 /DNA_ORIENTATION=+
MALKQQVTKAYVYKKVQIETTGRPELRYVEVRHVVIKEKGETEFNPTSQYVAVKVFLGREDPRNEMAAMETMSGSHHVVSLIEALEVVHERHLCAVMPYYHGEDLNGRFGVLRRPEEDAKSCFRQMMEGIRELHLSGLCHRDVDPQNVVEYTVDETSRCVLIDLGLAKRLPYDTSNQVRLLTGDGEAFGKYMYMSPEAYTGGDYDGEAADVWTAGTTLVFMITASHPYLMPDDSNQDFHELTTALPAYLKHKRAHVSGDCIDLLKKILKVTPSERIKVDEIFEHHWLSNQHLG